MNVAAERRNPPATPGDIATARALRREGLSTRLVAERMGRPRSTVAAWLKGEGETAIVKTCWCGREFIAHSAKAVSCCPPHQMKRYRLYGRLP